MGLARTVITLMISFGILLLPLLILLYSLSIIRVRKALLACNNSVAA